MLSFRSLHQLSRNRWTTAFVTMCRRYWLVVCEGAVHRSFIYSVTSLSRSVDSTIIWSLKVVPYLIRSWSQPRWLSNKPYSRLPLLAARPAITFSASITVVWPIPNYTVWWQIVWTTDQESLHNFYVPWFCSFIFCRFINHSLTYLLNDRSVIG